MRAAVTGSRQLADFEFVPVLVGGLLLVGLAVLAWWFPKAFAWPFGVLAAWLGLALLVDAVRILRGRMHP